MCKCRKICRKVQLTFSAHGHLHDPDTAFADMLSHSEATVKRNRGVAAHMLDHVLFVINLLLCWICIQAYPGRIVCAKLYNRTRKQSDIKSTITVIPMYTKA